MNIKQFQDFFLITTKEPGTDELADTKPVNEDFFEVTPLPLMFNSRQCIRTRKDKTIKIMSLKEIKKAG